MMDRSSVDLLNESVILSRREALPSTVALPSSLTTLAVDLLDGKFNSIVSSSGLMEIDPPSAIDPFDGFSSRVQQYFQRNSENSDSAFLESQFVAISLLLIFIRENYTGPKTPSAELPQSPFHLPTGVVGDAEDEVTEDDEKECNRESVDALSCDGELFYSLSLFPQYLHASKVLFDVLSSFQDESVSVARSGFFWWWKMRLLCVMQECLCVAEEEEKGEDGIDAPIVAGTSIRESVDRIYKTKIIPYFLEEDFPVEVQISSGRVKESGKGEEVEEEGEHQQEEEEGREEEVDTDPISLPETVDDELLGRLFVEIGLYHTAYLESSIATVWFQRAKKATGLKARLTGKVGQRSKYGRPLAFMLCDAASRQSPDAISEEENGDEMEEARVPTTVSRSEDYITETVDLQDEKYGTSQKNLRVVDQTILLALCLDVKNTNPSSGLTTEQMQAYLERTLLNPNNWMVHTAALLQRCRVEFKRAKTLERSLLQLDELLNQYSDPSEPTPVSVRMQHFFSLQMPPVFKLNKELADNYVSAGCVRSALALYEHLCLFEDIIKCYLLLGKQDRARDSLTKRLETDPENPVVWCLLGEIDDDPECFRKSWEFSDHKYAKAMRDLGRHFVKKGDFASAIPPLEASLRLNSVYVNAWFLLGASCMHARDWKKAANAFTHVVQLKPDNGEAWTNLSSIYFRTDRLQKAYAALKQALRMREKNARIWYNFLALCMTLGKHNEAITAVRQIAMKDRRLMDWEVVRRLVLILRKKMQDVEEMPDDPVVVETPESAPSPDPEPDDAESPSPSPIFTIPIEFEDEDEDEMDEVEAKVAPVLSKAQAVQSLDFFKRQLGSMFQYVSEVSKPDPIFWDIYAEYHTAIGDLDGAIRCRHRHITNLKMPGWWRREKLISPIIEATENMWETLKLIEDPVKKVDLDRMFGSELHILMKRIEEDFGEEDDFHRLQVLKAQFDELYPKNE